MNRKTFYQWIRLQLNRNDVVGDIAREVILDNMFPKYVRTSSNKIEKYLLSQNACDNSINCFNIAWKEYIKNNM